MAAYTSKYLDATGLSHLWSKIKALITPLKNQVDTLDTEHTVLAAAVTQLDNNKLDVADYEQMVAISDSEINAIV